VGISEHWWNLILSLKATKICNFYHLQYHQSISTSIRPVMFLSIFNIKLWFEIKLDCLIFSNNSEFLLWAISRLNLWWICYLFFCMYIYFKTLIWLQGLLWWLKIDFEVWINNFFCFSPWCKPGGNCRILIIVRDPVAVITVEEQWTWSKPHRNLAVKVFKID